MAVTTWKQVLSEIGRLKVELDHQHFKIDLAYRLHKEISENTEHRSDLNVPAIAFYWAIEIYNHYVLNDFDLKQQNVLFDLGYYSYLDLMEANDNNNKMGETTYIVDYIADTTDPKEGEDLDDWLSNSDFEEMVKDSYEDSNHDLMVEDDMLETRKNKAVEKKRYWNYANWLLQLRVFDQNFNTIVIFLLGTYSDYESDQ